MRVRSEITCYLCGREGEQWEEPGRKQKAILKQEQLLGSTTEEGLCLK